MLESKTYIATPPGATIKEQLDERGMKQIEFANRMGMSEKHISKLINGEVHLTADMAERLELVMGIPASFWNNLEAIYQEKLAKVKRENELEQDKERAQNYPYNEMAKLGIVPKTTNKNERVISLCRFFEVSCLELAEKPKLMPIACRKLSNTDKSFYSLLVLAQYAKYKARNMVVEPYARRKLKKRLKDIRALTQRKQMDFEEELTDILKECGIALVYLPKLPGSFLHGISFYDDATDKIVLGITLRGKYADKFWFSLFHELGHIMEGHIYKKNKLSDEDEKQADRIASDILIPPKEMENFCRECEFPSITIIQHFSQRIGIGIGIVIGRLQHDNIIAQSQYNQYKCKYEVIG